jgi:hypothetical protein
LIFDDPTFSILWLCIIAEGGCNGVKDIGECFTTAYRINERDFERQHRNVRIGKRYVALI